MKNKPSPDLELLIPILIGGLSVVGIVVILVVGRALSAPAEIAATPSSTPFQYVYLGTEPAISTLVLEGSDIAPIMTEEPGFTEEPAFTDEPVVPTSTRPFSPRPTLIVLASPTRTQGGSGGGTATATRTATPTRTRTSTPSAANTYDDTDSRLQYVGTWIAQSGVSGAYQETLHISSVAPGNSVTIQFSGREIYLYYQGGPSNGIITIYVDDDPLALTTVSQAQGSVWHYVLEEIKTHKIRIEHSGGGSINIDRFVIPSATPTPTRTPTP